MKEKKREKSHSQQVMMHDAMAMLVLFQNLEIHTVRVVVKVFEVVKRESLFHRDSFASFAKKSKPRSSFDFQ